MDTEENPGKQHTGRRAFLKTAAAAGTASLPLTSALPAEANAATRKQSAQFSRGREYVDKLTGMVRDLLAEDAEKLDAASDICAEAILGGRKVYYTVRGHNEPLCILEKRSGKPSFLLPTEQNIDYGLFVKGDVLITERSNYCAGAKERGVRLIGILMPFQPQKTRGQGIVHTDYQGPWMEDICEVCIWDRAPYTVGTMSFEQLPFKAVPVHGAMDGIILNLILAGTIDRLLAKGYPVSAAV